MSNLLAGFDTPRTVQVMTENGKHKSGFVDPDDWAALDARIAGFEARWSRSKHTHTTYRKLWRLWEEHCEDLGCDPRDAPWAAWQELAKRRRQDGRMYNRAYFLEAVLCAVRSRYAAEDLVASPSPCLPGRVLDWQVLCRSYRQDLSAAAGNGELEYIVRTPLLRADVARLIDVPPESIPFATRVGEERNVAAVRAELLVALETGWGGAELRSLRTSDFRLREDGSVDVRDARLPCDHRERVPGVVWDCAACAVVVAIARRAPHEPFVTAKPGTFAARLKAAARRWPGLENPARHGDATGPRATTLRIRAGLPDAQVAGTRRGLVLIDAINSKDSAWLLGRAWLGVAWEAGLRMVSDLVELPRSAVTSLPGGMGLVLRLGATKDDPSARKQVSRVFRLQDGPCAAQALIEYLTVRDAAIGNEPDGPLLVTAPAGIFGPNWRKGITKPVQVANGVIAKLAAAAAVEGHFTSYSARRGYATQSALDGRDLLHIQRGLRHARPDTTLRYDQRSAQRVARKFALSLAGPHQQDDDHDRSAPVAEDAA